MQRLQASLSGPVTAIFLDEAHQSVQHVLARLTLPVALTPQVIERVMGRVISTSGALFRMFGGGGTIIAHAAHQLCGRHLAC